MRPNLMVNEADDPEMDNVVIFPSFATRMSKSVAETFSVKNLNKIAAGIVLGGIIGVGGTLYYSKVPEKDRMVVVILDSPPNKFFCEGKKSRQRTVMNLTTLTHYFSMSETKRSPQDQQLPGWIYTDYHLPLKNLAC